MIMKISVEFDTQSKELIVTNNGKKINNLSSIVFYTYDGKGSVELTTIEQNEEEKMVKLTRVVAIDKDEFIIKERPIHEEIAELLFKKR